jgi:hypothetical protein
MPIGSAKIGVLGAGLVPGGTVTFNATGTFTVPPGVKKVNITGRGGTGNPGNAGNAGNPGNIGYGGTGGKGGAVTGQFGTSDAFGGGAGVSLRRHTPLIWRNSPACLPSAAGSYNTPGPVLCCLNQGANPGNYCPVRPSIPGYAGVGGTAGTAGNPGNPGTPGNASSGLNYNFAGGAGGNAGVGGNAGNGGSGGNGGGGASPGSAVIGYYPCACATPNSSGGAGGNGGGSGGAGIGTRSAPTVGPVPNTPANWIKYGGGGGGGAGVNDGSSGLNGVMMTAPYTGTYFPGTPSLNAAGGTDPGNPFNGTISPCYTNKITQNMTGGLGGSGGIGGARGAGLVAIIQKYCGQRPINDTGNPVPTYFPNPTLPYNPASRIVYAPTATKNITANNTTLNPLTNNMFRSGSGGGGGGYGDTSNLCAQPYNFYANRIQSAAGGGGGGRGNAGNAGGNSTAPSGSAGTPATYNCVPVTPGSPYPITVGGPSGGQVVISWNPQ